MKKYIIVLIVAFVLYTILLLGGVYLYTNSNKAPEVAPQEPTPLVETPVVPEVKPVVVAAPKSVTPAVEPTVTPTAQPKTGGFFSFLDRTGPYQTYADIPMTYSKVPGYGCRYTLNVDSYTNSFSDKHAVVLHKLVVQASNLQSGGRVKFTTNNWLDASGTFMSNNGSNIWSHEINTGTSGVALSGAVDTPKTVWLHVSYASGDCDKEGATLNPLFDQWEVRDITTKQKVRLVAA